MNSLTLTRKRAISDALRARDHLVPFAQYSWHQYIDAPHVQALAGELERIESGESDRLMVFMPPRHGKSLTVSIRFPAWYLCRNPERSVIGASYGELLSKRHSRATQALIHLPEVRSIFPKAQFKDYPQDWRMWELSAGGSYLGATIGSGITGHGADLFIIDDPIKSRAEAESFIYRQNLWEWYTGTALERLEPGGAIVLMHTRWHEDDLAGRILEHEGRVEDGGKWRVLSLPALAEDGDLIERKRGQALWPERYDEEYFRALFDVLPRREVASQFQQRPAPEEGDIFKWWPTYKALPRIERLLMPIDTAYTDTSGSDYTAWALWWDDGNRIGIMDAQQVQMETPEAEDALRRYYERIKAEFPNIPVQPLVRKKVAIDRAVGQHLRRSRDGVGGLPVVFVELPSVRGDDWKVVNAKLVIPEFEGERMLIPGGYTPWLEPWLTQHKQFPHGHDDWVETTLIVGRYKFGGRETHETVYHEDSWLGGQG